MCQCTVLQYSCTSLIFQMIDLAAMENGGICVGYSNVHFGHARNLIQPGRAETMADGWETARKVGQRPNDHGRNFIQCSRAGTMDIDLKLLWKVDLRSKDHTRNLYNLEKQRTWLKVGLLGRASQRSR